MKRPKQRWLAPLALLAVMAVGVGSATAQAVIEGNVQRVYDRAVIVVDNTPVRLWGVTAPRTGEAASGRTQLALRQWTLGQHVHCEPLSEDSQRPIVARCLADGLDLSAALVSSGLGNSCRVNGIAPYGQLDRTGPNRTCPP